MRKRPSWVHLARLRANRVWCSLGAIRETPTLMLVSSGERILGSLKRQPDPSQFS